MGLPRGDNYLHRKLINQDEYIYIVKCTFMIARDGATVAIGVRYLAHATP